MGVHGIPVCKYRDMGDLWLINTSVDWLRNVAKKDIVLHGLLGIMMDYPLVNKLVDPENHQFLMETSFPTPMNARVYVNLPEGKHKPAFEWV